MNKVGGKFVLWLVIIGMLVFTAIRTVHFLQLTFPPDQQYVAYLGLAAFDVGVLAWFYFATQSAEGAAQRWLSYAMIAVCAGGVVATTVADMTIVSHQNGLSRLPQDIGTLGLWAVIIVIILNVAAGILAHLLDPAHQKHFEMQNAKDVIHATTMQHIRQQAHTIAPQIATQVSQYWAAQVTAEMIGQLPGIKQMSQLAPPTVNSTAQSLPQTGELPAMQSPQQKDGLFSKIGNKLFGGSEPTCAADGTPAAAKVNGIWYCHECLDKIAANDAKPYMTADDMERMFHEWQAKQQQQSPLAQPQVQTQANHEGNKNGSK